VDFQAQYEQEKDEIHQCVERVFSRGDFVGGQAVGELEERLAKYCNVDHVIAVNSGTDAIALALKALEIGPGDEVITPPNSFIASTAAIVEVGAIPVFADVLPDQNIDPVAVEKAITPKTRAIMAVHLTGRLAQVNTLSALAEKYNIPLLEDAAQAIGSRLKGKASGSFGKVACFSTHPLKNLNAAGDGGFLTTCDQGIAEYIRRLRNHGHISRNSVLHWGSVSRMDTLQAELLKFRLKKIDDVIETRRNNALLYMELLGNKEIFVPPVDCMESHSFHTFVIQVPQRDALQVYLRERGVETVVHYPVPIHLQPAAKNLGYTGGQFPNTEQQAERILSLPIHQFLKNEQIRYVAESVLEFYERTSGSRNPQIRRLLIGREDA
jgi:dTDP-4-amino-4,6-dideoxygalactose transaminase